MEVSFGTQHLQRVAFQMRNAALVQVEVWKLENIWSRKESEIETEVTSSDLDPNWSRSV
jgi:hypothetical protein